ncbi:four-jointed box protein 1 [Tachyglossus aculeatus]|uniref:four-jointed box protein 1 n=1 Tax=Tachyglossus aculeatus TaxID=9261 RepID=UPI0018F5E8D0|nr:four-jointed box protein 1 [Tachyglossus aculeatus]
MAALPYRLRKGRKNNSSPLTLHISRSHDPGETVLNRKISPQEEARAVPEAVADGAGDWSHCEIQKRPGSGRQKSSPERRRTPEFPAPGCSRRRGEPARPRTARWGRGARNRTATGLPGSARRRPLGSRARCEAAARPGPGSVGGKMRGAAATTAGLWLVMLGSLLALWSGLPQRAGPGAGLLRSEPTPAPRLLLLLPPRPGAPKTFRALLTLPAGGDGAPPSPAAAGLSGPPRAGPPAVHGGIFWSRRLEEQVPRGFSEGQAAAWLEAARAARVVALERGGCGRSSNRLARFADGTRACVRYGISAEQIQGEALSYYLARLLGLQRHVPPLALARVEPRGAQWARVQDELRGAHWAEGSVVSLTRWLPNLTDVVAPAPWRSEDGRLRPLRAEGLANRTQPELVELVQWTDLIVFDYLTANFDRLVSNLFSLQWDPRVMQRATSNLHRAPGGGLVFIDNEAGLVHGYRLVGVWDKYHEPLLRSVCVFRERTVQRVLELHERRDAAAQLLRLYRRHEPRFPELAALAQPHAGLLQRRLHFLADHIARCRARDGAP